MKIEAPVSMSPDQIGDMHNVFVRPEGVLYTFAKDSNFGYTIRDLRKRQRIREYGDMWGYGSRAILECIDEGDAAGKTYGEYISGIWGGGSESIDDFINNISPDGVINENSPNVTAMRILHRYNKRLFLVTDEGHVWIDNVVKHLQLSKVFEQQFSDVWVGHGLSIKHEYTGDVIHSLSHTIDLNHTLFINDDEEDIVTAHAIGLHVLHVTPDVSLRQFVKGK